MSFSFEFFRDGIEVSQPNFIFQLPDGVDNRFGYQSTDVGEAGVYSIRWTITIPYSTNFPGESDKIVVNTHTVEI